MSAHQVIQLDNQDGQKDTLRVRTSALYRNPLRRGLGGATSHVKAERASVCPRAGKCVGSGGPKAWWRPDAREEFFAHLVRLGGVKKKWF
jgi:hypothetical protein